MTFCQHTVYMYNIDHFNSKANSWYDMFANKLHFVIDLFIDADINMKN